MADSIIITGFMGCGKTSIGKILGKKLKLRFYDTDELIEKKTKKKIFEIFQEQGEEYFRKLENEVLCDLKGKIAAKKVIIATGGGTLINYDNLDTLKKLGKIIYLKINAATALERIKNTKNRPIFKSLKDLKEIEDLIKTREECYLKAHYVIEADHLTKQEVVLEILKMLKNYG